MTPQSDLMTFLLQMKTELRADIRDLDLKLDRHIEDSQEVDNRVVLLESKVRIGERVGWGMIVALTTALGAHVKEIFKA